MNVIRRIIRGSLYAGILIGMLVFPGCYNPVNQGALSEPAPGEGVSQETLSPGQVRIRFTTGAKQRNLYPEIESFSKYVLNFVHEDGGTVPDAVIEGEDDLLVDLKAGTWKITASGFAGEGDLSVAAARGSVDIRVEAGEEVQALIVLDTIIPGEGVPGVFSYTVEFPQDLVSSAVMELSFLGEGETYIPYMVLDLGEPEKQQASLSLPSGYYRMNLRLGTVFPVIRKTEILHIYPAMETRAPPYHFDESEFPVPTELEGIAALEAYLTEQPENTRETPYLVRLRGINLDGSSPEDGLAALYGALVRYTALDLRDCTGDSVSKVTLKTALHKANLVSLILPGTVTAIQAEAFTDCKALVHVEAPGLSSIDLGAFKNCTALESVYMPLVETIADTGEVSKGVFRNCSSLYSVFLPRARSIGGYAFYGCTALDTIFLPAGKILGANAFKTCSGLISGSLPQVESIGDSAFHGCMSFISLMLGEDPPVIEAQTFTGGRPAYIYVPAAGVEAYKETAWENWTKALKAKIRALPS